VENVAVGKPAYQISTGWDGVAARAVDGNRNGQYWDLSCQHTLANENPWWVVDLQDTYDIAKVTLVNRGDCCREFKLSSLLDCAVMQPFSLSIMQFYTNYP